MFARQLIALQLLDDSALGPDALRAVRQAFDEVWREIGWRFGAHLVAIETARLKLANILLSIASEESRDADVLKCFALQAMARHNCATLPTRVTLVDPSHQAWRMIHGAATRDWRAGPIAAQPTKATKEGAVIVQFRRPWSAAMGSKKR